MRRVVVTGLGIISSIGNNASEVLESLKAGRSGITANEVMKEYGFRSQIAGDIKGRMRHLKGCQNLGRRREMMKE